MITHLSSPISFTSKWELLQPEHFHPITEMACTTLQANALMSHQICSFKCAKLRVGNMFSLIFYQADMKHIFIMFTCPEFTWQNHCSIHRQFLKEINMFLFWEKVEFLPKVLDSEPWKQSTKTLCATSPFLISILSKTRFFFSDLACITNTKLTTGKYEMLLRICFLYFFHKTPFSQATKLFLNSFIACSLKTAEAVG